MGDDFIVAAESDAARLQCERLQGELDAALVFAAAADHHYQNGKPEFAAVCLSDAEALSAKVMAALSDAELTGAQLQDLKAKLIRLKHVLDGLHIPSRNEAA